MYGAALAFLVVILAYLAMFFWLTGVAARASGKKVWLFASASGRDWLAAIGFRASFAIAVIYLGVAAWLGREQQMASVLFAIGLFLSVAGAMIGFAAQASMGTSWRVGVQSGAVGELVGDGLFAISRNPVFAGQILLLFGMFVGVPALATLAATVLFALSATLQIRSEEMALSQKHGQAFSDYAARVPRWFKIGKVSL